ncbi:hypothetical protein [Flavobacterium panici]|uniref:Uncharacterized protein n=1 Tax=Flavobacterium panici TaxID=2654843 RepID=A0A9N8J1S3_9FLAO|nr:hypothetical protein [Flavobacterium panici]CAC9974497.1 hypothetical protein FLAPXU55_02194 [Flavobacterium panici]
MKVRKRNKLSLIYPILGVHKKVCFAYKQVVRNFKLLPMKEKYFGIGCFHFGIKTSIPSKFSSEEYIENLENVLTQIPGLNNLELYSHKHFKHYEKNITKKLPKINDGKGFFPADILTEIEFHLNIPYKTQKEISKRKKKNSRIGTEDFRIRIIEGFYLPVTIVECLNPTKFCEPSQSIILVREYIKKCLKTIDSDYISFEFLGPSPFHLDCYIRPKKFETQDLKFQTEEVLQRGYGDLIIYYNEDEFKDSDEAFQQLEFSIIDELSFFYNSIQLRVRGIRAWSSIQKNLSQLLKFQKLRGFDAMYSRFFEQPKIISELYTKITTFEANSIFEAEINQHLYDHTFNLEETFFKKFIDKELNEKYAYPTGQVTNLISFFESRRVKNLELTMAMIAAIIGGAIGSIVTLVLQ